MQREITAKSIQIMYVMVAILTAIALYAPLVVVFIFSFNSAQRGMIWEGFSPKWYKEMWFDNILVASVFNTLKISGLTCGISVIGGLGCGYLISLSKKKVFLLLATFLFLPILIPDLIASLAQSLFYQWIKIGKGILTVSFSQSFFGISYVALFVSARLRTTNFKEYLLAASSLGASPFRCFIDHFIPLAIPAAVSGMGVVGALSIQDFLFAFFCGGVGSTTLSVKLYSMVKFSVNSSMNVVYVLLIFVAVCLFIFSEIYRAKEVEI